MILIYSKLFLNYFHVRIYSDGVAQAKQNCASRLKLLSFAQAEQNCASLRNGIKIAQLMCSCAISDKHQYEKRYPYLPTAIVASLCSSTFPYITRPFGRRSSSLVGSAKRPNTWSQRVSCFLIAF